MRLMAAETVDDKVLEILAFDAVGEKPVHRLLPFESEIADMDAVDKPAVYPGDIVGKDRPLKDMCGTEIEITAVRIVFRAVFCFRRKLLRGL